MKTSLGGVVSIIIILLLIAYTALKSNIMFQKSQNTVQSLVMEADLSTLSNIDLNETGILVYYRVRSSQYKTFLVPQIFN